MNRDATVILQPCPRCGSSVVGWDGLKKPMKYQCGRCRHALKRVRKEPK